MSSVLNGEAVVARIEQDHVLPLGRVFYLEDVMCVGVLFGPRMPNVFSWKTIPHKVIPRISRVCVRNTPQLKGIGLAGKTWDVGCWTGRTMHRLAVV